jgi:hypothetical protein
MRRKEASADLSRVLRRPQPGTLAQARVGAAPQSERHRTARCGNQSHPAACNPSTLRRHPGTRPRGAGRWTSNRSGLAFVSARHVPAPHADFVVDPRKVVRRSNFVVRCGSYRSTYLPIASSPAPAGPATHSDLNPRGGIRE